MRRTRPRADRRAMGLNVCSLCDTLTLTFGPQRHGGIRHCESCLHKTLGWQQLNADQQDTVTKAFMILREDPTFSRLLAMAAKAPPGLRKAIGDGETQRRMWEAER